MLISNCSIQTNKGIRFEAFIYNQANQAITLPEILKYMHSSSVQEVHLASPKI